MTNYSDMSKGELIPLLNKRNAPAVQGEPVAWKEPAANWLREKAAAQQALSEQYPEHAKCYPTCEKWILNLNWLADELSVGVAPQRAEQQPIRHDWDDQDRCRRCGDRDWYASATCSPKQQSAPDVSALVEALERFIGAWVDCQQQPVHAEDFEILTDICEDSMKLLAAHLKQGGDV